MSDVSAPQVRIIWPPEDSLTPADAFDIIGVTFDASGISKVEVTLTIPTFGQVTPDQQQPYQLAEQFRSGDWKIWASHVTVTDRKFSRILARATDNVGNPGYYEKRIVYPDPPPPPPPPPPFSLLTGVNWYSQVLRNKTSSVNKTEIANRAKRLGMDKVNFIRLPFSMDAFEFNRARALSEMNTILSECNKYGIQVLLDLHQHDASPGNGDFPSQYMAGYTALTMWKWWQDVLQNKISGFWNAIGSMWEAVVNGTKQNGNLVGYELLNEPKFPPAWTTKEAVFTAYGNFYTAIANRIRAIDTSRFIAICEGNKTKLSDQGADGIAGDDATLEPLIFPPVAKVTYDFHRYRLLVGTNLRPQAAPLLDDITRVIALSQHVKGRGIDWQGFFCGEYAVGTPSGGFLGSPNSLESMLIFLSTFKSFNVGSTYWAAFGPGQDGRELYKQSATDATGWVQNDSGGLIWNGTQYASDAGGEGKYYLHARSQTYGY